MKQIHHLIIFRLLTVIIFSLIFPFYALSQKANWQNLDIQQDSVFGISTEKAYQELLKRKKGKKVKVAVLDSGVDILHEDFKKMIWTNKKEKINGKDDDKNGYIDDRYGWNFLGSDKGSIEHETMELTRLIRKKSVKFSGKDSSDIPPADTAEYRTYISLKKELEKSLEGARKSLEKLNQNKQTLDELVKKTGKENPDTSDFEKLKGENPTEEYLINIITSRLDNNSIDEIKKSLFDRATAFYESHINYHLNLAYNPRYIVGDNEDDTTEKYYGNADIVGPDALHGTHVAGIIAALRNNKKGIKGIASNVKIISVRCVPDGDERDKDVANAIRYATDHGAKIINMSFGKPYSPEKHIVDEAVQYAVSKDVLLIHAAGNDNKNIDIEDNFPTKFYNDGSVSSSWIEVGASSWNADSTLKAPFSNYGKKSVDVFAPGMAIKSTTPDSKYESLSGTSMAAPVVSGVAALIRSHYPHLTAFQVKEIIMKSVIKPDYEVKVGDKKMLFSELCVSGGIVNAYEALKLAATYSKK